MNRIASGLRALRLRLQRLFRIADWQATLLWAIVAGVLGALATEVFRGALHWADRLVLGGGDDGLVALARSLPWWARIAVPALGGLVAGGLLVLARRTAVQKATSDYMEAIVLGDGRIPVGQTLMRSASSLVSIASGGSIGREGSMVQLAALCASLLGQWFRFPVERLRLLVACGAAAGLTAAYNAPIAGAFFVAEIVLGSIAMESIGPIMVASVVANVAMRALPGYQPAYEMPAFPDISGPEVLLFAVLGVLLGGAAALFLRGLGASRALFARLPLALPGRLALGGLVVGLISVEMPEVWGNGYSVVNSVLHTPWPWTLLALVLAAKFVATMATAGSGAVGGVFTPALFFGCMIGGMFGQAAQALWPHATSAPFAYAIVGMGAFLAGASQAPLMAILMIFEMTLSYQVMLPLMAASVIAYFVARSANAGSMYEITVRRREQQDERLRLRTLHVRDLVQPPQTVVRPDAGVQEMRALFLQHPVKYLYVVDDASLYLGVVPLKALTAAAEGPGLAHRTAGDLLAQEISPVTADMNLGQALQRFMEHRGERLPVIESADNRLLLGVVAKSALLATYVRLSE
ncbi:MAG: ClcB-like voltage-gated chloride channel protein [Pseudomonadota bacterium]